MAKVQNTAAVIEAQHLDHRYRVGQRVSFSQGGGARFTVVRLMPPRGKIYSYRIKGDAETYERAADESQLTAMFD